MLPLTTTPPSYQVVADDIGLAEVVRQCETGDWVAIDTEFVRTRTYYPQVGLIQIAYDGGLQVLDPVAIKDPSPLAALLRNPAVVKVMHACSEDLEVFQRYLQQLPEPLFDTQIAAAVLGYGFQVSYKALVSQTHQIDLPKEEQRSDWLARPLSRAQLDYAVLDVTFLAEIYQQQRRQLQNQGRLTWVEEECAALLTKQQRGIPPAQQYQRIKGAGTLDGMQLSVLQALAAWRETEAVRRDSPRTFLLKDQVLLALAQQQPLTVRALAKISNIHPKVLRKDGARIIEIISQAVNNGAPLAPLQNTLPRQAKPLLKRLQQHIETVAKREGIPAPLMMNRKQMVSCVPPVLAGGGLSLPEELSGWKRRLLAPGLEKIIIDSGADGP